MGTPAAPPFEVTETAAGRLYRLPPRQLGQLRVLAIFPLFLATIVPVLLVQSYLRRAAQGPLDEWAWVTYLLMGIGWTRAAYTLASLHNLYFIQDLMRRIRDAIRANELSELRDAFLSRYGVAYPTLGVSPQSAGGQ